MRDARLPSVFLLSLLLAAAAAGLGAQASPVAPAPPPAGATAAGPAFRAEGGSYVARGSGSGALESEALERARAAALRALFAGLGKDRLFAEVFLRDPPIGLVFITEAAGKEGALFAATVSLRVDDESLRIVARGPFLAAALSLLDEKGRLRANLGIEKEGPSLDLLDTSESPRAQLTVDGKQGPRLDFTDEKGVQASLRP